MQVKKGRWKSLDCLENLSRGRLMKYILSASVLLILTLTGCASHQEQAAEMTSYERAEACQKYQQRRAKYEQKFVAYGRTYEACRAEQPKLARVETKCRSSGGGSVDLYPSMVGGPPNTGSISTSGRSNCVSTPIYEKSCSERDLSRRLKNTRWSIDRAKNAISAYCG